MDNLFWQVKGYSGLNLTKEKLEKDKYSFEEIKKEDLDIVKNIEDTLEKDGVVFCLHKKNVIKMVYFFKLTNKAKKKNLVFDKSVVLDEVKHCVKGFEKDIHTVLNAVMTNRHDVDKTIWQDKEITSEQKFKSSIATVKSAIWIAIIFCCIACIVITAVCTMHSLNGIASDSVDTMLDNKSLVNYVSMVNNFDYIETLDTIEFANNKMGFVFVYVILPSIGNLLGFILMVISLIYMLDLIKGASDNKTLFTKSKYRILTKALLIAYIAGLFLIGDLLVWLALSLVVEAILYMFSYCVHLTENSK